MPAVQRRRALNQTVTLKPATSVPKKTTGGKRSVKDPAADWQGCYEVQPVGNSKCTFTGCTEVRKHIHCVRSPETCQFKVNGVDYRSIMRHLTTKHTKPADDEEGLTPDKQTTVASVSKKSTVPSKKAITKKSVAESSGKVPKTRDDQTKKSVAKVKRTVPKTGDDQTNKSVAKVKRTVPKTGDIPTTKPIAKPAIDSTMTSAKIEAEHSSNTHPDIESESDVGYIEKDIDTNAVKKQGNKTTAKRQSSTPSKSTLSPIQGKAAVPNTEQMEPISTKNVKLTRTSTLPHKTDPYTDIVNPTVPQSSTNDNDQRIMAELADIRQCLKDATIAATDAKAKADADAAAVIKSKNHLPTTEVNGNVLRINVGGKFFTTLQSTLLTADGMLARRFFEENQGNTFKELFIDREATYFGVILDWLRDNTTPLPLDDPSFVKEVEYYELSAAMLGTGNIYVSGGWRSGFTSGSQTVAAGITASVEIYSPKSDSWRLAPSMPIRRQLHAMAKLGKGLVVIGGENFEEGCLKSAFRYVPEKMEWVKIMDYPEPSRQIRTVAIFGKLIALGGIGTSGHHHGRVYEYDATKLEWTKKRSMPQSRTGFGAIGFNSYIYIAGGYDGKTYLTTVLRYDVRRNTWKEMCPMLTARYSVAMSVLRGYVYVIGGGTKVDGKMKALSTVERYDPGSNTWVTLPSLRVPRISSTSVTLNGMIYVLGGQTADKQPLKSMEGFDADNCVWLKAADLLEARTLAAACVI